MKNFLNDFGLLDFLFKFKRFSKLNFQRFLKKKVLTSFIILCRNLGSHKTCGNAGAISPSNRGCGNICCFIRAAKTRIKGAQNRI